MLKLSCLLCIGYLTCSSECARILCYFSIPLYSRQAAYRSLVRELSHRGHQVVVITTRPQPPPQFPSNVTEIDVSSPYDDLTTIIQSPNTNQDSLTKRQNIVASLMRTIEQQFQSDPLQETIKNKFDLLIVEALIHNPALGLSHILDVPVIIFATNPPGIYEHEIAESEEHAVFYPHVFENFQDHTNLYQQVVFQWYFGYKLRKLALYRVETVNEMLRRTFGPDMPSVAILKENVRAVIVNVPWLWDHNRPVTPKMAYVAKMTQESTEELNEDLQSYLDSSAQGVIYVSFGSALDFSTLPEEYVRIFLNVFSVLKYDVLVKCNGDLPRKPTNVRVEKWLPQTGVLGVSFLWNELPTKVLDCPLDYLPTALERGLCFWSIGHSKLKLFITHGGLQSIMEAVAASVPMLGVPMYSDQRYNVRRCVELKVALDINLETLTEERLLEAINALIKDSSFAAETRRVHARLESRGRGAARASLVVERVLRSARAKRRVREICPELPLLMAAALMLALLLLSCIYLVKVVNVATRELLARIEYKKNK